MKNTKYLVILLLFSTASFGQDFSKNIATARNSYAAGNLEEARFAMQQMLNDLDMDIYTIHLNQKGRMVNESYPDSIPVMAKRMFGKIL